MFVEHEDIKNDIKNSGNIFLNLNMTAIFLNEETILHTTNFVSTSKQL